MRDYSEQRKSTRSPGFTVRGWSRAITSSILTLALVTSTIFAKHDEATGRNPSKALEAISSIISSGYAMGDYADQFMRDHGYQPANEANWISLPVVRKLEAGYMAMEQAYPHEGGGRFLAMLTKALAQEYEAVRAEPSLKPYLELSEAGPKPLVIYRSPALPDPQKWSPSPEVKKAISTIAEYCEGNAFGSTQGVLRDYFGLAANQAYEILRTSETNVEALERGLTLIKDDQQRDQKLRRLVADIDQSYGQTSLSRTELDYYRAKERRKAAPAIFSDGRGGPPTDGPGAAGPNAQGPNPGTGPGGGAAPKGPSIINPSFPVTHGSRSSPADQGSHYGQYYRENYSRSSTRGFRSMISKAGGFGGVVFGNEIKTMAHLKALTSIRWKPSANTTGKDDPASGNLIFQFKNSAGMVTTISRRFFGPVLQEDAYAAQEIVFGKPAGLEAWQPGEGIGLVGIDDRVEHFDLTADKIVNKGVRWRVIMHPALVNLDLGWAALMTDILPIHEEQLLKLVEINCGQEDRSLVKRWLNNRPGDYKFTDAALLITSEGTHIVVERQQDSKAALARSLRRASLLNFQAFGYSSIAQLSEIFPRVVPVLTRASAHYERINRFAAVLALFRWAKMAGARLEAQIEKPAEKPTPESMIITDQGFIAAPNYDLGSAIKELQTKIIQQMRKLTENLPPGPRKVFDRQYQILAEIGESVGADMQAVLKIGALRGQIEDLEQEKEDFLRTSPSLQAQLNTLEDAVNKQYQLYYRVSYAEREQALKGLEEAKAKRDSLLQTAFPNQYSEIQRLKSQIEQLSQQREERISKGPSGGAGRLSLDGLRKVILQGVSPEIRRQNDASERELAAVKAQLKSDRLSQEEYVKKKREYEQKESVLRQKQEAILTQIFPRFAYWWELYETYFLLV